MRLSHISEAIASKGVTTSIAVVVDGAGNVLMGKSTAKDARGGKWCFPGGGIKEGTVERAAERECLEETGISCRGVRVMAYGSPSGDVPRNIAFVLCSSDGGSPRPNSEFSEMAWMRPGSALQHPDVFGPNRWILGHLTSGGLQEDVSRETLLNIFARAVVDQVPTVKVMTRLDGSINLFSGRRGLQAKEVDGQIILSSQAQGVIAGFTDPMEAMAVAVKRLG